MTRSTSLRRASALGACLCVTLIVASSPRPAAAQRPSNHLGSEALALAAPRLPTSSAVSLDDVAIGMSGVLGGAAGLLGGGTMGYSVFFGPPPGWEYGEDGSDYGLYGWDFGRRVNSLFFSVLGASVGGSLGVLAARSTHRPVLAGAIYGALAGLAALFPIVKAFDLWNERKLVTEISGTAIVGGALLGALVGALLD